MRAKVQEPHEHPEATKPKYDFLLPFVVSICLVTPTMTVLALTKDSAGFAVLTDTGVFTGLRIGLWLLVGTALVSGVIYMLRTPSWALKVVTILLLVPLLAAFAFVLLP